MRSDGNRIGEWRTGAIMIAAALLVSGQAPGAVVQRQRPVRTFSTTSSPAARRPAPARAAAGRRPTAATGAPPPWSGEDGASGHPLMTASAIREAAANFDNCVASMWPDAARRNIIQENFERFTAGLDARSAHHGSDGFAARIHQVDLGLSRHPGQRQSPRQGPRDPRQIQAAVRRGGKGLWRRPLHHRGDLGHRIELLDPDGRSQRAAIHRDARLHRPPPELFQG